MAARRKTFEYTATFRLHALNLDSARTQTDKLDEWCAKHDLVRVGETRTREVEHVPDDA